MIRRIKEWRKKVTKRDSCILDWFVLWFVLWFWFHHKCYVNLSTIKKMPFKEVTLQTNCFHFWFFLSYNNSIARIMLEPTETCILFFFLVCFNCLTSSIQLIKNSFANWFLFISSSNLLHIVCKSWLYT